MDAQVHMLLPKQAIHMQFGRTTPRRLSRIPRTRQPTLGHKSWTNPVTTQRGEDYPDDSRFMPAKASKDATVAVVVLPAAFGVFCSVRDAPDSDDDADEVNRDAPVAVAVARDIYCMQRHHDRCYHFACNVRYGLRPLVPFGRRDKAAKTNEQIAACFSCSSIGRPAKDAYLRKEVPRVMNKIDHRKYKDIHIEQIDYSNITTTTLASPEPHLSIQHSNVRHP